MGSLALSLSLRTAKQTYTLLSYNLKFYYTNFFKFFNITLKILTVTSG